MHITEEVDYILGAFDQLFVFSKLKRCVHHAETTGGTLADGVRVDFGLEFFSNAEKIVRLYAPERLQVCVDLVVFVGQLDCVFSDIVPP